jgi:NAD(P)-dependent dehydrogenase (short-subunit alcohol dehydrogenase family)
MSQSVSAAKPAVTLDGQHAVVTGGGRGIGAGIAHALAAQGANLTLMGRTEATLEGAAAAIAADCNVEVAWQTADVTDEGSVAGAFSAAAEKLGSPAILVNNAGGAESAPFKRTDAGLLQRMVELNLMSTFHCIHQVLPAMVEAGYGRIINVASTAGLVGYRYVSAYVASKHAVVGLTKSLALENAKTGVTVNSVCPGYVDTDMTQETIRNIVEKTGVTPAEAEAQIAATNPQARLIQPAEIAAAVVWLAQADSGSITGQSIAVAGGEIM